MTEHKQTDSLRKRIQKYLRRRWEDLPKPPPHAINTPDIAVSAAYSALFKLPYELRQLVYEYTFLFQVVEICRVNPYINQQKLPAYRLACAPPTCLNLLLVCKAVYYEARPVYVATVAHTINYRTPDIWDMCFLDFVDVSTTNLHKTASRSKREMHELFTWTCRSGFEGWPNDIYMDEGFLPFSIWSAATRSRMRRLIDVPIYNAGQIRRLLASFVNLRTLGVHLPILSTRTHSHVSNETYDDLVHTAGVNDPSFRAMIITANLGNIPFDVYKSKSKQFEEWPRDISCRLRPDHKVKVLFSLRMRWDYDQVGWREQGYFGLRVCPDPVLMQLEPPNLPEASRPDHDSHKVNVRFHDQGGQPKSPPMWHVLEVMQND